MYSSHHLTNLPVKRGNQIAASVVHQSIHGLPGVLVGVESRPPNKVQPLFLARNPDARDAIHLVVPRRFRRAARVRTFRSLQGLDDVSQAEFELLWRWLALAINLERTPYLVFDSQLLCLHLADQSVIVFFEVHTLCFPEAIAHRRTQCWVRLARQNVFVQPDDRLLHVENFRFFFFFLFMGPQYGPPRPAPP